MQISSSIPASTNPLFKKATCDPENIPSPRALRDENNGLTEAPGKPEHSFQNVIGTCPYKNWIIVSELFTTFLKRNAWYHNTWGGETELLIDADLQR